MATVTGLFALATTGCLTLDENGLELQLRLPYQSTNETLKEDETWQGERLVVRVERGTLEVVGLRQATNLRLRANALTWSEDVEDAKKMHRRVLDGVRFERHGNEIRIACAVPDDDVGTALANATQCNLRLEVPAPEGAMHDIDVRTDQGNVVLHRLATGPTNQIRAWGTEVRAFALRGNVHVVSAWADIECEPMAQSLVSIESKSGDWYYLPSLRQVEKQGNQGEARFGATLRLPKSFTTQHLQMSSVGATVDVDAFPGLVLNAPSSATESGFGDQH